MDRTDSVKDVRCPACGYRFAETDLECRAGCPFSEGCHVACCPRCGYRIVRDTRTVQWLRKVLGGAKETL